MLEVQVRRRWTVLLALVGAACASAPAAEPPPSAQAASEHDAARPPRLLSTAPSPPPAPPASDELGWSSPSTPSGNTAPSIADGGPLRDAPSLIDTLDPSADRDAPADRDAHPDGDAARDGDAPDANVSADAESDASAACGPGCEEPAPHLLISEVAFRPAASEMIELVNPTAEVVDLSNVWLSDSDRYAKPQSGLGAGSTSDFIAHFPAGAQLGPGHRVTVALANASGGSASFQLAYGRLPDFELRPTAHDALDDPAVPNMVPAAEGASIGSAASLTDEGEPVVLFQVEPSGRVRDLDYVFYGRPSDSNPVVDKSGSEPYGSDTAAAAQRLVAIERDTISVHRCSLRELGERAVAGNGVWGHDETSEDLSATFAPSRTATPGEPPPEGGCAGR